MDKEIEIPTAVDSELVQRKMNELVLENKILRLHRAYAVIHRINEMIVRVQDSDKLFEEACRITIESGKFRLVWIGLVDEKDQIIKPFIWNGLEFGFLEEIKNMSVNDILDKDPVQQEILNGNYFVCNNIERGSGFILQENGLKHGFHSLISLPIIIGNKVKGSFNIYADEKGFFNEDEVKLLREVAGDISFSLESITKADALKKSELLNKRIEHDLIVAKERSEAANKLKDAFIANISHEIRTPLSGIQGMSSLIKEIFPGKINKEDEELFNGITYSCQRIIRTVDMILNYSLLQVGEFPLFRKNLNLSDICIRLVNEFGEEAKNKSLNLTFENNYGEAILFGDENSSSIAISHLIDNAIKFTNKGFINVLLHKGNNEEIMLDIKDTGIGIGEGSLEIIFEPFRQEQMGYGRAYDGIGLGLSLVEKILALNNARVRVESKKEEGTTFSINFGNRVKVEKNHKQNSLESDNVITANNRNNICH